MAPKINKTGCKTLSSQIITVSGYATESRSAGACESANMQQPNQPSRSEGLHGVANGARALRHEGANLLEEHQTLPKVPSSFTEHNEACNAAERLMQASETAVWGEFRRLRWVDHSEE